MIISTTTLGAGAVGALLKPVIADLYAWAKEKIKPSDAQKILNSLESFEIGTHVYKTINVKTLWNVEREVSLFEFYYPSRVAFPDRQGVNISSYSQIPDANRYIIQGTAGQGKSIFLRYLYGMICFEAADIKKVPIFIELRKITSSLTIRDHVAMSLRQLGFEVTRDNVDVYLSSNKVILLLDAFDEIDNNLLTSAIVEIEDICSKFVDLPVTITARPDSGIQNLALFRVAKLEPLREDDLLPFLKRVCQDHAQAEQVHQAIKSAEGSGIENLLRTPLLVTLLVWLYRAQSTLPSTLTKFYEQLFDVMFYKHDQSKPGFKRLRYTNLDDEALKELFECFCFQAKILGIKSFDADTFVETCRKAVLTVGIEVTPSGLRSELIKTACLLVEDGLEISYIHRSVSEFYAARFVKNSSEEFARDFYIQVANEEIVRDWLGELGFLEQIDGYRFAKYFMLAQATNALFAIGYVDKFEDIYSSDFYRNGVMSASLSFVRKERDFALQSVSGFEYVARDCSWFTTRLAWVFLDAFMHVVGAGRLIFSHQLAPADIKVDEVIVLTYADTLRLVPQLKIETDEKLLEIVNEILKKKTEAQSLIAREEAKSNLVQLMKPTMILG